jgi:ribosomal 30S subunit maturation factor RimM
MGRIRIGRALSAHGLKGEIAFKYYNEALEDIYHYTSFVTDGKDKEVTLFLEQIALRKKMIYLKFRGID